MSEHAVEREHRAAALDALTHGLRALKSQIAEARSSLALTPPQVRRLKARLERWRAAHSALSCEQGQARLDARQAEWDAEPSEGPREVGYQAPVFIDHLIPSAPEGVVLMRCLRCGDPPSAHTEPDAWCVECECTAYEAP